MKKQIFSLIAVAVIIGIAVISVISCSKTEQGNVNKEGIITHFSPMEKDVVPLISQFNQRFENHKAGYKSGGDIPLGEALWTLEAGVNYEFRCAKDSLQNFVNDSLLVTTNVFIGENNEYYIIESNAMDLYEDMLTFTGEKLGQDKNLLVTDVEIKAVNGQEAEMKVTTVSGEKKPNPYVINETDYWYPVMDMDKCGPYEGQYAGIMDASDRLRKILNATHLAYYWTDIETFYLIYNGFYPCEEEDCFWEGYPNECLDPYAMQHWKVQAQGVVEELQPEGKHRIEAYLHWGVFTYPNEIYYHYFDYITYGIPQGDPPG
ncbi:MAG: hypothetical protein K8R68_12435 [Bacteroidales bacterium]|nr:hypothetical protein [Bacteroidales bacterium]